MSNEYLPSRRDVLNEALGLAKKGGAVAVLATLESLPALAQSAESQEAAIMKFTPEQVKSRFVEWINANPQGTASIARPWAGPQHMYDNPRREAFIQYAKKFMFGSVRDFDIGTIQYENPSHPTSAIPKLGPLLVQALEKKGDQTLITQVESHLQRLKETYDKLYSVYKPNGHVSGAKSFFEGAALSFLSVYGERLPTGGRFGQGGPPSHEQDIINRALAVAKLNDEMTKIYDEFLTFARNALAK